MRNNTPMKEREKAEIQRLRYEEKWTVKEIQRKMDRSRTSIVKACKEFEEAPTPVEDRKKKSIDKAYRALYAGLDLYEHEDPRIRLGAARLTEGVFKGTGEWASEGINVNLNQVFAQIADLPPEWREQYVSNAELVRLEQAEKERGR